MSWLEASSAEEVRSTAEDGAAHKVGLGSFPSSGLPPVPGKPKASQVPVTRLGPALVAPQSASPELHVERVHLEQLWNTAESLLGQLRQLRGAFEAGAARTVEQDVELARVKMVVVGIVQEVDA